MPFSIPYSRRAFVQLAASVTLAGIPSLALGAELRSPTQMEGPFYPLPDQRLLRPDGLRDNDLTRVAGVQAAARGQRLLVAGCVTTSAGRPPRVALVEIWQACLSGRYLHSGDRRRTRAHDPGFQYWGVCETDAEGRFAFKTIVPPAYPSGLPGWMRPPHLHVRVTRPGEPDFITQFYLDDPRDLGNEEKNLRLQRKDLLLRSVGSDRRGTLICPVEDASPTGGPGLELPGQAAGLDAQDQDAAARTAPAGRIEMPVVLSSELHLP